MSESPFKWADFVDVASYLVGYGGTDDAEYVDTRVVEKINIRLSVTNGKPLAVEKDYDIGMAIRVFHRGVQAIASLTNPSKSLADELSSSLIMRVKTLSGLKGVDRYSLHDVKSEEIEYEVKEEKPFIDHVEEALAILKDLDYAVKDSEKIELVNRTFSVVYTLEKKYFTSSDQVVITSTIPRIIFFGSLVGKNGGFATKTVLLGSAEGAEFLDYDYLVEEVGNRVKAMENLLTEAKAVPSDRYNIVVGPEITGIIAHEAVGHPFEFDRVVGMEGAQAGESYLSKDDIGRRIGSHEVTVVDNPQYRVSYGFYKYDDDGVEAGNRILIRDGVVNSFLLNRFVASRYGLESNGSSRASSYRDEPIVRMGITFFQEGELTLEELLEEAGKGILIKDFTEWNIDDRRINQRYTGFEAYLINNGRIGPPVKYPVIESTTMEILSNIAAKSDTVELFPGFCGKGDPMQVMPVSMGGPYLLIRDMPISSR